MTRDRLNLLGGVLFIVTAAVLLSVAPSVIGWMVNHRWHIVAGCATTMAFIIAEAIYQEARR